MEITQWGGRAVLERDRELLARAASVNRQLGIVVSDMLTHQLNGQLPAAQLHCLGEALAQLGTDMMMRSSEIGSHVLEDAPNRMITDTDR